MDFPEKINAIDRGSENQQIYKLKYPDFVTYRQTDRLSDIQTADRLSSRVSDPKKSYFCRIILIFNSYQGENRQIRNINVRK